MNEAKELEQLLLGKNFHTHLSHRLFDEVEPDQQEKISQLVDSMITTNWKPCSTFKLQTAAFPSLRHRVELGGLT